MYLRYTLHLVRGTTKLALNVFLFVLLVWPFKKATVQCKVNVDADYVSGPNDLSLFSLTDKIVSM